jgi:hypothetical protein
MPTIKNWVLSTAMAPVAIAKPTAAHANDNTMTGIGGSSSIVCDAAAR